MERVHERVLRLPQEHRVVHREGLAEERDQHQRGQQQRGPGRLQQVIHGRSM
jgi:hypothetical protein